MSRLDLSAQTHRQLTSLNLYQMQGLDSFPVGLAAHSKLQIFHQNMRGQGVSLSDFFAPFNHICAPPLPQMQSLTVFGVVAPAFPAAITRLIALTYLFMMVDGLSDQFQCLHPGLTALQQLRWLTLASLPRLKLDKGIVLGLSRLRQLCIMSCDDLSIEGGLCMLIRNHPNLTHMWMPGTKVS